MRWSALHRPLVAGLAVALCACGPPKRFYEPVGFWEARADVYGQEVLPLLVEEHLERGRIRDLAVAAPDRGLSPVPLRAEELAGLPDEVLFAAHACSTRRARGGEYDLLVRTSHRVVPVTVWASPDGALVVARGSAPPTPRQPPDQAGIEQWKQELADRYGLAGIEDAGRDWSLTELGDLAAALDRLSPDEQLALQGLMIGRAAESRRMPKRELAFYDPRAVPPRIDFFDLAFEAFDSGFVGPVEAPVRAPVMTLLHEFGHALADLPLRRAWERYVALDDTWRRATDPAEIRARETARRQALRTVRRMGLEGPVIDAYREVRGRRRGPTSWAWKQVHESFAEAFALHHLDPAALQRVMPEVHAWFADGGHLSWLEGREAPVRSRSGAGPGLVE